MRVAIYLNGSSHTPTTTTPMTEFTQPCHRNHVSVITFTYLLGVLFANKKNLRLVKKQIRSKAINWLYNNWSNSNIFYLCDRAVVARTTEKKVCNVKYGICQITIPHTIFSSRMPKLYTISRFCLRSPLNPADVF